MTETTTAAPAGTFPVFKSYNGLSREEVAALFTSAADVIKNVGYTAYPDYEGENGTDIQGAFAAAATRFIWSTYRRAPRLGELRDYAEELVTRLGGVILVAGTVQWGDSDHAVNDFQTEAAEGSCTKWAKNRTEADMIALLNLAAQMTCLTW